LPFSWDEKTTRNGLNFTLETAFGDLDLLGEVAGGGTYPNLLPDSQEVNGFGLKFRIVTLPRLIALKRAAGRPKDLPMLLELQELAERQQRLNQSRE
jgi:predicted nucleotidyltransferase